MTWMKGRCLLVIVEFSVTNFKSINERQGFNMTATREQKFSDRVPRFTPVYRMRLSPVASVYGANASGKTNFVRALAHMKSLVMPPARPDKAIPFHPFKLDPQVQGADSEFDLYFMWDEVMYRYLVSHNRERISSEGLWKVTSGKDQLIFTRNDESRSVGGQAPLASTLLEGVADNLSFIRFLHDWSGQSDNIIDAARIVSAWFSNLTILEAGSGDHMIQNFTEALAGAADWLPRLGAGLDGVEVNPVRDDVSALSAFTDRLAEGESLFASRDGQLIEFKREEGEIKATEVALTHMTEAGESVALDWSEESDGTRHLVGLLMPMFRELGKPESKTVVVIDEFDRSLHTHLALNLISSFLNGVTETSRSQLVLTTHDLMLMDFSIFRKDEIWVVEKDESGQSTMIALSEYEGLRNDKDVRKSYMEGRFGGIPVVQGDVLAAGI